MLRFIPNFNFFFTENRGTQHRKTKDRNLQTYNNTKIHCKTRVKQQKEHSLEEEDSNSIGFVTSLPHPRYALNSFNDAGLKFFLAQISSFT